MKKILTVALFALLCVLINTNTPVDPVQAAGGAIYGVKFNASPSAGKADGASAVTIAVQAIWYRCSVQVQNSPYEPYYRYEEKAGKCEAGGYGAGIEEMVPASVKINFVVSGSGNILSATSVTTDGNGYATFTIKSSVAETKTIDAYYPTNSTPSGHIGSMNLTFSAPVAAAPKVLPKIVATVPAEVAPPAAPVAEIIVDGSVVKLDEKPSIKQHEPLHLSGKTVPNGVVTIYVFSEPKKYTATADKDGNWSYEVTGLPAGDHHIEAEVTDPATGKTSPRAQVLAFSVVKSTQPAVVSKAAPVYDTVGKNGSELSVMGIIAAGLALLGAAAVGCLWKFKPATFNKIFRAHG